MPLTAGPRPARAEEPKETVELSWVRAEGAETCPDAAAIRAGVARRLGRNPFGAQPSLAIEAMATRGASTWNARIVARRDTSALGTRTLDSTAASCDSLADAVALAIALLIDPDAVSRHLQASASLETAAPPALPPPASKASPSAPVRVAAPGARASAPPEQPPKRVDHAQHVLAEADAIASFGLLPGAAFGAALEARVPFLARLSAAAGFEFFPEREVSALGGRFGFGLTSGLLGLCAEPFTAPSFGLELCAQAALGAVHAVVYRLEPTVPGDRLFSAAGLVGRLFLRPQRNLRISLGFGGWLPFAAYRFSVHDETPAVFAQSQLAASALVGLGVAL